MDPREVYAEIGRHRRTLYLNTERVKDAYIGLGGVTELSTNRGRTIEGQVGAPNWIASLSGKIGGTSGRTELIRISEYPEPMALILEDEYAKFGELVDLSLKDPTPVEECRKATLLRYQGHGRMTWPAQELNPATSDVPSDLVQVIESERVRQQNVLRAVRRDQNETVMVWTAVGTDLGTRRCYASIAATRWLNGENHATDLSENAAPLGILGDLEKHIDDLVFIRPFWIWLTQSRM